MPHRSLLVLICCCCCWQWLARPLSAVASAATPPGQLYGQPADVSAPLSVSQPLALAQQVESSGSGAEYADEEDEETLFANSLDVDFVSTDLHSDQHSSLHNNTMMSGGDDEDEDAEETAVVRTNLAQGSPSLPDSGAVTDQHRDQQQDGPPRLRRRLGKLSLEVGAAFSRRVPPDLFFDSRQLQLLLTAAGGEQLPADHWLQFDNSTQLIYALPKESDVGEYKYQLIAVNTVGQRAADTVHVSVRQFSRWRTVNHLFQLHLQLNDVEHFSRHIDWQLFLAKRLARLVSDGADGGSDGGSGDTSSGSGGSDGGSSSGGDGGGGGSVTASAQWSGADAASDGTGDVAVYSVKEAGQQQQQQQHPAVFVISWFNRSLSTSHCDLPQLRHIAALLQDSSGAPSERLIAALAPHFLVTRVDVQMTALCSGVQLWAPSQPAVAPPHSDDRAPSLPGPVAAPPATGSANSRPYRRRSLDLIQARVGQLLQLQIPADTFHDSEDGDTRRMRVQLLTGARHTVPPHHWLRLEPNNQEFIGVPLADDVGSLIYHLECVDSGGLAVTDSLEVQVQADYSTSPPPPLSPPLPPPLAPPTVQFSVTLAGDYDRFMADSLQRALLVLRLMALFDDRRAASVTVTGVRRGSVVLEWYNASLPTQRCAAATDGDSEEAEEAAAAAQVQQLRRRLLDPAGRVTAAARAALAPHFALRAAAVVPRGQCLAAATPTHSPPPPMSRPHQPADATVPVSRWRVYEYLNTFVLPALVIALLLLTAALVACLLLRVRPATRRHRRKAGSRCGADSGAFARGRGVPVIFADELTERQLRRGGDERGGGATASRVTSSLLPNGRRSAPPIAVSSRRHDASSPMLPAFGHSHDDDNNHCDTIATHNSSDGGSSRYGRHFNNCQPPPYTQAV